jgi:hypothetical protein
LLHCLSRLAGTNSITFFMKKPFRTNKYAFFALPG